MLYKVMLPNDYFPVGAFVEETDGMMQKVRTDTVDGRLMPGWYEGVCIPADKVRKYCHAILKRGFDDRNAHAELRKAY